jgi:hypothetical protein
MPIASFAFTQRITTVKCPDAQRQAVGGFFKRLRHMSNIFRRALKTCVCRLIGESLRVRTHDMLRLSFMRRAFAYVSGLPKRITGIVRFQLFKNPFHLRLAFVISYDKTGI